MKKCIVCNNHYTGHGHNAEPVRKGECCDACNYLILIRRMQDLEGKPKTLNRVGNIKQNENGYK